MFVFVLFVELEKYVIEVVKLIQIFEKVFLVELVFFIMKIREYIYCYRIGGIVLKEEDFSILDFQNWVNDKVNMNIVYFLFKLKIKSVIKS